VNQNTVLMSKPTSKQIKAQAINEVQRQYAQKIKGYEQRLGSLTEQLMKARHRIAELSDTCSQLEDENNELRQTNSQYKDWVERMQDFCNLPEDERQQALKTYLDGIKARSEADEAMACIGRMYSSITSMFK